MSGGFPVGLVAAAAAFWCAATFFWAAMLVACFTSSLTLRSKTAWLFAIATTHAVGAFVFYFQHVREAAVVDHAAPSPAPQTEPVPFLRAA